MFTIRHIEFSGHESVRECRQVWRAAQPQLRDCGCDPGAVSRCAKPSAKDSAAIAIAEVCPRKTFDGPVYADVGDEHPLTFQTGELFVMNDQGRTVAKYEWR